MVPYYDPETPATDSDVTEPIVIDKKIVEAKYNEDKLDITVRLFYHVVEILFNLKHRFWMQILPRISRTSPAQYPLNPSPSQVEWAITSIQQGGRKYTLNVEFGTVDGPGAVVTDPTFLVVQVIITY